MSVHVITVWDVRCIWFKCYTRKKSKYIENDKLNPFGNSQNNLSKFSVKVTLKAELIYEGKGIVCCDIEVGNNFLGGNRSHCIAKIVDLGQTAFDIFLWVKQQLFTDHKHRRRMSKAGSVQFSHSTRTVWFRCKKKSPKWYTQFFNGNGWVYLSGEIRSMGRRAFLMQNKSCNWTS